MTTGVVPGRQPPQLDEFETQRLDARDVPMQRGAVDNPRHEQGVGACARCPERVQRTQQRGREPARDPKGVVSDHIGLRFGGMAFPFMVGASG